MFTTISSNAALCLTAVFIPITSLKAEVANLLKFKANLANTAVAKIKPGPPIKLPIPVTKPLPIV